MPEATPTLRDSAVDASIAADWDAIQEKYALEPDETRSPEPAEAAEPAKAPVEAEQPKAADATRDEQGRFKPKPKEAKEAKPAEATDPKPAESKPAEALAEPASDASRDVNLPPSTWRPTARAEWEKLPPAVRA